MDKRSALLVTIINESGDISQHSSLLESLVIECDGIYYCKNGDVSRSFMFNNSGNGCIFIGIVESYGCFKVDTETIPRFI